MWPTPTTVSIPSTGLSPIAPSSKLHPTRVVCCPCPDGGCPPCDGGCDCPGCEPPCPDGGCPPCDDGGCPEGGCNAAGAACCMCNQGGHCLQVTTFQWGFTTKGVQCPTGVVFDGENYVPTWEPDPEIICTQCNCPCEDAPDFQPNKPRPASFEQYHLICVGRPKEDIVMVGLRY